MKEKEIIEQDINREMRIGKVNGKAVTEWHKGVKQEEKEENRTHFCLMQVRVPAEWGCVLFLFLGVTSSEIMILAGYIETWI